MQYLNTYEILVVSTFLAAIMHKAKSSIHLSALLNLVGTIFHELLHYIFALLLNGKPTGFISIWPKKENGLYVLGSINCSNIKWYNAFPIAFAPLLLFVLGYYTYVHFVEFVNFLGFSYSLYTELIMIFIVTTLILNAIPSQTDIKAASESSLGLAIYAFLIAVIVYRYFNKEIENVFL